MRWGILSTARITEEFVSAVRAQGQSEVVAVASRDPARAKDWARRFRVPHSHGSYEDLLDRSDVDAVYVPLPNSMHAEWTIKALEAGKHVLCEKPMALKVADVDRVFAAAARVNRLVMEGFMFRHHPVTRKWIELVGNGALGEIVSIRTWHGFTVGDKTDIRYSASLGGGALADLGCYCIAGTLLALAGVPLASSAIQAMAESGVDESTHALLSFGSGAVSQIDCSMRIPESAGLHIVSTDGQIEIPQPWFPHLQPRFWLVDRDGHRQPVEAPGPDSYVLEIDNFVKAAAGQEEPAVDRDLSTRVVATLALIEATAITSVPAHTHPNSTAT